MAAKGLDYYNIEELYSEDEIMIRDTVREWVHDKLMPIIGDYYEKGEFPHQLVPEMAEMGLLGANLPEEFGCAGLNNTAYGLIMQELEYCDSGIRSFVSVQGALCMYPIFAFGSEEQKKKWLPAMAAGEKIGCFGLTEPDGGSDPGHMKTRAVKTDSGWLLNGAKMWITNGTTADVAVVWATVEEDGKDTVRGFLVEKGTPGYSAPEQKRKYSLRASVTSELVFQDVELPEDAMLPGARGLKGPLSCLTQARYGISWGGIGAAMACYDEALDFSKTRVLFGRPIAGKQLVQNKLVWMLSEITKGQLLTWRLSKLKDAGTMRPQHVSLAKRTCVQIGLESARMARDILGANGITAEYNAMRHMCNLESVYTYEGTHDIHTLILGEDITGERAL